MECNNHKKKNTTFDISKTDIISFDKREKRRKQR